MTDTEYQQLVEFLTRRFTAIDQRFDDGFLEAKRWIAAIDSRLTCLEHVAPVQASIARLERLLGA